MNTVHSTLLWDADFTLAVPVLLASAVSCLEGLIETELYLKQVFPSLLAAQVEGGAEES